VKLLNGLSENTRIALVGVCAIGIVGYFELPSHQHTTVVGPGGTDLVETGQALLADHQPAVPLVDPGLDDALLEKTVSSVRQLDPELETLLQAGAHGTVKNRLLTLAAAAVADGKHDRLAEILSLLGQVSIEQQNLGAAEVYLFEALDVLEGTDNEPARAEIYLQLGRAYLKSREVARNAGYSYDALQIGRNQMAKGQYQQAEQSIQQAISQSLSIHRYNAAASAYQSLSKLYGLLGNQYESEQASLEAVRLYSSSGQSDQSRTLLGELRDSNIEDWRLLDVDKQIEANQEIYEDSIEQIGIARDYRRLYNYYLNEGNIARAWHFRLLASKSLEEVSKRAMFHRQQGVLALLYNSNDAMARAKKYFSSASDRFASQGNADRLEQTAELKKGIY